jgi:hypothetical protein
MALENFSSGKKFLSIADGKLVQTFKEAQPGTKERINKNSKVVHEMHYDAIVGEITAIGKKENDYGIFLTVDIKDGEDIYQISTQFSGRYSSSLLKALPNINLANPVRLLPWSMIDKNDASRKITGITLYQHDGNGWVKIAPFYTKDEPNGLPEMVKVKIKGKESWDDTDMMDFLFAAGQNCFQATNPASASAGDDIPF